jgi:hypothetical protein
LAKHKSKCLGNAPRFVEDASASPLYRTRPLRNSSTVPREGQLVAVDTYSVAEADAVAIEAQ